MNKNIPVVFLATLAIMCIANHGCTARAADGFSYTTRDLPRPPMLGTWFLSAHEGLLREQMEFCAEFEAAGNGREAFECRSRTTNAHAYLLNRATYGTLPEYAWLQCTVEIQDYMPLGARCIAAAEQICPVAPNGNLKDPLRCNRVMQSGAWVASPAAMGLILDEVRRYTK